MSNLELFFQVEIWLNHVLAHMKATVRHEMTEGVTAYEEKPREQWLFDYPAQVLSQPDLRGPRPPLALSLLRLPGSLMLHSQERLAFEGSAGGGRGGWSAVT